MNRWYLCSGIFVSLIGLAAVTSSAYAEQPPDVVESDAHGNTASGDSVLPILLAVSGIKNSAFGEQALDFNSTGKANTAIGANASFTNISGSYNTAIGTFALSIMDDGGINVVGSYDAAIGSGALGNNVHGSYSTAMGNRALYSSDADNNTACGFDSLSTNATGTDNSAFGVDSLHSNTSGGDNEAQGVNALFSNIAGIRNLGIGSNALYDDVTGSYNVALGFNAGYNQTTGNDNIYIDNQGLAGESQTLWLGAQGKVGVQGSGILSAYIAGVATSQVTGSALYVTPNGQLGVLASSERFKTAVETMRAGSERLARLRPVTFKIKADPRGTRQYGLIAEEVAQIYPELSIHGADGRIDGVRYEELIPMLLHGIQQQQAQLAVQARKAHAQAEVIRNLEARTRKANLPPEVIHHLETDVDTAEAQAGIILDLQVRAAKARAQAEVIRNLGAQVTQLSRFEESMTAGPRAVHPRLLARAP